MQDNNPKDSKDTEKGEEEGYFDIPETPEEETLDESILLEEEEVKKEVSTVVEEPTSEKLKNPNAKLDQPYSEEVPEDDKDFRPGVSLPSISYDDFISFNEKFSEVIKGMGDMLDEWRGVSRDAFDNYTPEGHKQKRFHEEGSEFYQGVNTETGLKSINALKFKKTEGELRGEMALLRAAKFLGLGEVVNVPLPHSGIWVTIKPPTEKDLIDFYNMAFREKIILGRATSGYTLTNMSVHINNRLFDLILRHVHAVNFEGISVDNLKDKLVIHDFPILAWGFACTMYPNGFDYQRSCMNDVEKCSHVSKSKLNLNKLLWIDNPSLSDTQKEILSDGRANANKLESYVKYQEEHKRMTSEVITVREGVRVKLRLPTFTEYTTDGLKWVNSITNIVERVLVDSEEDEEGKLDTLNHYVRASILCQFNHFIEWIEIGDNLIKDRATIDSTLSMLSGDDTVRSTLSEAVSEFKSKTSIAIIGIPDYSCPKCNHEQKPEFPNPNLTSVIPLDVMNMFFLMFASKISKILDRET